MKKTTQIKNGEWSWEETSETRAAIERLHRDIKDRVKEDKDNETPTSG